MGILGSDSSKIYAEKFEIKEENLTKPDEAQNYVKKTGVSRTTAWRNFNILEKLGLVSIHRQSGGKPNEIMYCYVPIGLKAPILKILKSYQTKRDLIRSIIEILSNGAPIAQWIEQSVPNREIRGSNPRRRVFTFTR